MAVRGIHRVSSLELDFLHRTLCEYWRLFVAEKSQTGIWNPSTPVEESAYCWTDAPKLVGFDESRRDRAKLAMVDLFCGAGGFSVGFEAEGFQSVLGVDHLIPAMETYSRNRPGVGSVLGDIRGTTESAIVGLLPPEEISVMTAGVPCQGFSLANRKRHDEDSRNFLFREFVRIADAIKPRAVVVENVSGMVSSAGGKFVNAIRAEIEALGFDVYVKLLNAAEYGVPQVRHRLFFVGVPRGVHWSWPVATHGLSSKSRTFETVWDAISDLPVLESGESSSAYLSPPRTPLQVMLRRDQKELYNHESPRHPIATVERIARTKPGQPMYESFRQRVRLDPDLPSPTQLSGGIRPQFQFGHPTQARGLTVRERARVQTFPDSYRFFGGVVQGRVQTGNAVPVLLASALAKRLYAALEGQAIPDEGRLRRDASQLGLFAST